MVPWKSVLSLVKQQHRCFAGIPKPSHLFSTQASTPAPASLHGTPSPDAVEYDPLVDEYDSFRTKSNKIWTLELENVSKYLPPLVKNASVLELACGSGFYAYDIANWGASSYLGVDISSGMLDKAKRLPEASHPTASKVKFLCDDCRKQTPYPGSPFDVLFSAYFLPVAPDRKTLVDLLKTVRVNMKTGGTMFAVVTPGVEDQVAYFELEKKTMAENGLVHDRILYKEVEDGICYRVRCNAGRGDQYFYGYRLRKSVYDVAAQEAGFTNRIEWKELRPPTDEKRNMPEVRKQLACPDFGIIVLKN